MVKYSLLLFLFFANSSYAQRAAPPVALAHYVFDSFRSGKVQQKSGAVSEQPLNYNILTGEMIFDAGGKYLAIAAPQNVDTVFIDGRKFVPVENKFYEVLTQTAAPLLLEFTYTVQEPGASLGYGATSTTTAATPLKTLIQTGGAYALQLPDDFKVKPGRAYWILKDGRYLKANNAQQLHKIFPARKSRLNELVKKNNTRFQKKEDVIALVQQLQQ